MILSIRVSFFFRKQEHEIMLPETLHLFRKYLNFRHFFGFVQ